MSRVREFLCCWPSRVCCARCGSAPHRIDGLIGFVGGCLTLGKSLPSSFLLGSVCHAPEPLSGRGHEGGRSAACSAAVARVPLSVALLSCRVRW